MGTLGGVRVVYSTNANGPVAGGTALVANGTVMYSMYMYSLTSESSRKFLRLYGGGRGPDASSMNTAGLDG
jgi:hypothetical protein